MKLFFKIMSFCLGGAFSIGITAVMIYFVYNFTFTSFDYGKNLGNKMSSEKPSKEVEITLENESTIDEVAKILQDNEVIENALLFKLESKLKGTDRNFQAGTYIVNTNMDNNQLDTALRFVELASNDQKITVLEGYRIEDIARYLENKEILKAKDFIEACNTGEFDYGFLEDVPKRENRLEGYLFPDTYFISEKATPEEIINKMLKRFDEIYNYSYVEQGEAIGLSMDQVITIASIIEKEIKINEERSALSALIKNRLASNMNLQMLSTVVYALDKKADRLTEEDLNTQSPYNTFVIQGLPHGPICNPGKASIEAVLNPEDSNVLYFVLTNKETNEHLFTASEEEYLSIKKQQEAEE